MVLGGVSVGRSGVMYNSANVLRIKFTIGGSEFYVIAMVRLAA